MDKLLVICGPTATGKTKLALHLAGLFNGEVISSDSRQVYKYMDIGTGKEGNVLGYDLVLPNEEFSVFHYLQFAEKTIKEIYAQNKLPILTGGTGLYIKAVVDGIDTADIAPNLELRKSLENKTVEELFNLLTENDFEKARTMNESDRRNPRRLIRAIEVAMNKNEKSEDKKNRYGTLFIGLSASKEKLEKRISERVDERAKGLQEEIDFLKNNGFWDGVAKNTIGYKDWPDIEKWKQEEIKYAKRQMTWFKKEKRIKWFDVSEENFTKDVEKLIKKWYI
ncbi:MAG TPA: tRNA (adenosine(37)-N6)-dimethylallyltransferase MiaA [Candidatus Saccharimonadales bacterium]|nr:tRNA (adenosine(37)-N6)-dimethylallyltransferase MiaA [Candidatus Saccharimonadales bacterium]